jgi:hypothetical protein
VIQLRGCQVVVRARVQEGAFLISPSFLFSRVRSGLHSSALLVVCRAHKPVRQDMVSLIGLQNSGYH